MRKSRSQALARRRQGAVSFESVLLLGAVVLTGVLGFTDLGQSAATAVQGDVASVAVAPSLAPAPVATRQAGLAGLIDDLAEMARRGRRTFGLVGDAGESLPPEIVQATGGRSHVWPGYRTHTINPKKDMMNCSACAKALDLTLEGTPASARPFVLEAQKLTMEEHVASLVKHPERIVEGAKTLLKSIETLGAKKRRGGEEEAMYRLAMRWLVPDLLDLVDEPDLLPAATTDVIEQIIMMDVMANATDLGIARSVGKRLRDWRSFKNMKNTIAKIDRSWPDRAKGLITIQGKDGGMGHVFNVLKYNGRVYFLDGQIGAGHTYATWDHVNVRLLRTKDIPASVDIEGFYLPPPVDEPVSALVVPGRRGSVHGAQTAKDLWLPPSAR